MSQQILAATRKGLFTIAQDHGQWTIRDAAFLGDNLSLVGYDSRDSALYAAFSHGHFGIKLQRSDDGGKNWQEIAAPAYPADIVESPPLVDDFRKVPIPWSVQLIWALEPGGSDQPGTLWLGTIPGGLFRSDNRGESWELERNRECSTVGVWVCHCGPPEQQRTCLDCAGRQR